MQLLRSRALYKGIARTPFVTRVGARYQSEDAGQGASKTAPYRPEPFNEWAFPGVAQHWAANGFPQSTEAEDEYPKEELYLDEIEERMRKYDKKYRKSDRYNKLYNEFGEDWEDTAFKTYGSMSTTEYGRGKKLDPSWYVNSDAVNVNRTILPPVHLLTADQVRRTRGSLASWREMIPENPSIWKYWGSLSAMTAFASIAFMKERLIIEPNVLEQVGIFCTMCCIGALVQDWWSWWYMITVQEQYDKNWMPLNKQVKDLHTELETISNKPDLKTLLVRMGYYRDYLSEKVLHKTLQNQLLRNVDSTIAKLKQKISEEAAVKREAESQWKRDALQQALNHCESDKVRQDFTKQAIADFCKGDTAKITGSTEITPTTSVFEGAYQTNFANAQKKFIDEQKKAGTLSWVFVDEKERDSKRMSANDKQTEFTNRVKKWESTHNSVGSLQPAF